ncbi:reverse transcriptase domain-containing protein [Tanacetum coccineum]|uniref:Reverse transcriptase domain-containing protein n=1 Tax=Tanacetum coccineum TaxID=301880 RepID=A0ABQ5GWB3_9ASTR
MKQLIAKLPALTAREEKKELIVYLAAAKEAVSTVLMTEREAKQMPIYFVSCALRGPEVNYTSMEKLVLALVHANFIVERPEEDSPDTLIEVEEELLKPWILFTDRLSCGDGFGAGLILTNPEGAEFTYALRFRQMWIPELKEKSINELEVLAVVEEEGDTWMTQIYKYLTEETPPAAAKKGKSGAAKITTIRRVNGVLYKKSFLGPWLRCVRPLQANYVLREIHEGSCSMHANTRSVVAKSLQTRYYWPTMYKDSRARQDCQAHRTMIKSSNGDTPFSLTYGTKAVIPVEIGMPTLRTTEVDMVQNDEALEINLDLLEERREHAAIREAKRKAKMEKYYNSRVCITSFKPGDLVYRSNDASRVEERGKLSPKWEGPYEVTEALGNGAYKLRDHDGKQLL